MRKMTKKGMVLLLGVGMAINMTGCGVVFRNTNNVDVKSAIENEFFSDDYESITDTLDGLDKELTRIASGLGEFVIDSGLLSDMNSCVNELDAMGDAADQKLTDLFLCSNR